MGTYTRMYVYTYKYAERVKEIFKDRYRCHTIQHNKEEERNKFLTVACFQISKEIPCCKPWMRMCEDVAVVIVVFKQLYLIRTHTKKNGRKAKQKEKKT